MEKKVSRRGRPTRQAKESLARRPKPLIGPAEGASFRLLRPSDARADISHYWARQSFYAALRSYAPDRDRELAQAVSATDGFLAGIEETIPRWCRRYRFFVPDKDGPDEERVPDWLVADMYDSYLRCPLPKHESFRLRAFWRGRTEPVFIEGQLAEADIDSAELRVVLRVALVGSEDDESGATVPVVRSRADVKRELVERFTALVDLELSSLFDAAAERGVVRPSQATLDTAMRRYVLKQFRRLDSLDIAAGEVRGDDACEAESTDYERKAREFSARRRDVDDAIKDAGDLLGVPARYFPPGRKPKRSLAERRT
jgi:hypothetical protein